MSDGKPAAQASLTLEHASGIYLGAWTSTVEEPETKLAAELQLFAGYELALTDKLSLDVSANYYAYHSDWEFNYVEMTAVARVDLGDASAALGWSFVPKQGGTSDETSRHRNGYVFAEASYELPGTPVRLTSSLGYESGYFDGVVEGGKWDWSIGAETKFEDARIALAYVGSDTSGHGDTLVASQNFDF